MRIAIVNDLALAREVLRRVVQLVPGGVVAWQAADGEEAVRLAVADRPDVILMDLVMPKIDGAEATRQIMRQSPCPILVVTSTVSGHFDLVYQAMGAGGLDAVQTPALAANGGVVNAEHLLARIAKLRAATATIVMPTLTSRSPTPANIPKSATVRGFPIIAIGASTGGPSALARVLGDLPRDLPAAMLVAQHIAGEFAGGLASWLGARCRFPVRMAVAGDVPHIGEVLIAASDDHLVLRPDGTLAYTPEPRENPYRPAADVLFNSLVTGWHHRGVGVVLTGMGHDGAEGLLRLRNAGWHTIAQNESTCVVYGMPKAAAERRAAVEVLPLDAIGPAVLTAAMRLRA